MNLGRRQIFVCIYIYIYIYIITEYKLYFTLYDYENIEITNETK